MLTESAFYDDGKLMSFGKYDSVHKYWRYYSFYETGQIELTKKLDPISYWAIDTSLVYHRNGKVAWIFPYTDSGYLTGKLIGYYQDGSIKREAYYYRSFRTGTWKEYYQNGKPKSISYYEITPEDSLLLVKEVTTKDRQNSFAQSETFTWGELGSKILYDNLLEGQTRFTITTFVSKKTGVWKTFDSSGNLRDKRLTDFENTVMVKNLIEMHGLSAQIIQRMYENSSSFEELAQMFQDNIDGHKKAELLKIWHEADAGLLEALNKPRLVLGLGILSFKEE
jgi:hypothetical protein